MASDNRVQVLRTLIGQDHFAAEQNGLYPGMADEALKHRLNVIIDAAVKALSETAVDGGTDQQLLATLKQHLSSIDRHDLDTEDAEQVAGWFEAMLEALEIDSSNGILNTWMYGFEPDRS